MASRATFGLKRRVFVNERTLLVGMALYTCCICTGRQSCLLEFETAVGIVTITALHHAFKDLLVKWLVEIRLNFVVTTYAELRLASLQEEASCEVVLFRVGRAYKGDRLGNVSVAWRGMRRVTIRAAYIVAPVFAAPEIIPLLFAGMTGKAGLGDFLRRLILE